MKNTKEYNTNYYQENKERIKEMCSIKIHCEICNKNITKWNYDKHKKTKKCCNIKNDNIVNELKIILKDFLI
jgi:hypothetical protein